MGISELVVQVLGSIVSLAGKDIELPASVQAAHPGLAAYAGQKVVVGLRPEHLPAANGTAGPVLAGDVDLVEALGSELVVHFTIDARRVRAEGATTDDEDATAQSGEGVARVDPATKVKMGEKIRFAVNTAGMQFFDPDTEQAIWS